MKARLSYRKYGNHNRAPKVGPWAPRVESKVDLGDHKTEAEAVKAAVGGLLDKFRRMGK